MGHTQVNITPGSGGRKGYNVAFIYADSFQEWLSQKL